MNKFILYILISFIGLSSVTFSQINKFQQEQYMIGGITITGNSNLDKNSILSLIDLKVGDNIFIPGDKIQEATKTLWSQELFSDIQIFETKKENNIVYLEFF